MQVLDIPFLTELTALRRDIHAHPELAFDEARTADIVARELARYGLEVHRGIARTGVVGVLKNGTSSRSIGLRADMDALPMDEKNEFPTRCWLACNVRGGAASTIEVDGWEVRSIRLGRG